MSAHTHTTNTKYIYKAIETERMKVYKKRKGFPFWMGSHKTHTHTHFIYIECTRYGKNRRLYGLWFFHVDFVLYKDRRAMYILCVLYIVELLFCWPCAVGIAARHNREQISFKNKNINRFFIYLFTESHGHFEKHIKILSWLCCCWICLLPAVDGCLLLPIRPSRQTGTRLRNWQLYRR